MADRDWLGLSSAIAVALIGSGVSIYIAWSGHRRDDEGDKKELRVLACDIHTGLVRSGISNHRPDGSHPNITIPRMKISEYESLSPHNFKNLSQKAISDIDKIRKSIVSLSKDEDSAIGYQDPEKTVFIYDSDPSLYEKVRSEVSYLDSVSIDLAQDVISHHTFSPQPNSCELGRDP